MEIHNCCQWIMQNFCLNVLRSDQLKLLRKPYSHSHWKKVAVMAILSIQFGKNYCVVLEERATFPSWSKNLKLEGCCSEWCTNLRETEKQNERLAASVNCLSHQTDFLIPLWLQLAFLVQISQCLCGLHMLPMPNEGALAKGEAVIRASVRAEDRWHAKTSLLLQTYCPSPMRDVKTRSFDSGS